jgi:hypothetical protein
MTIAKDRQGRLDLEPDRPAQATALHRFGGHRDSLMLSVAFRRVGRPLRLRVFLLPVIADDAFQGTDRESWTFLASRYQGYRA